nr:L,D-transpeptidase family protein [Streptomyces oceani]
MVSGAAVTALSVLLGGCVGGSEVPSPDPVGNGPSSPGSSDKGPEASRSYPRVPGVGDRMHARIPQAARQVVAVYGQGRDSARSTVALYTKDGDRFRRQFEWRGHNGRRGWTPDHREGDKRSPTGVFTLTDAGGVLPDPGSGLPYTQSESFTPPTYWPKKTRHDFDRVIAIDYNRVRGTSPLDPTRPRGQSKGGGIWLHVDHGSGTSGCVSISSAGMKRLLRTLDPDRRPVVVMGDRDTLRK